MSISGECTDIHVARLAQLAQPTNAPTVELGNSAKDVVLSRDPGRAAQISRDDDAMDDLHRQLFEVLMDKEWTHGVAAAFDVTLLGRFYERFADHAVKIGRRIIFQATGQLPDT
jgi:phosphate transport system protein